MVRKGWSEPLAAFVALACYPDDELPTDEELAPICSYREAWRYTEWAVDLGLGTPDDLWQKLYGRTVEEFFSFSGESGSQRRSLSDSSQIPPPPGPPDRQQDDASRKRRGFGEFFGLFFILGFVVNLVSSYDACVQAGTCDESQWPGQGWGFQVIDSTIGGSISGLIFGGIVYGLYRAYRSARDK